MDKCTWKDCDKEAKHKQVRDDGISIWAHLCEDHHKELEKALCQLTPKAVLRAWVLASGGAKTMTDNMFNTEGQAKNDSP